MDFIEELQNFKTANCIQWWLISSPSMHILWHCSTHSQLQVLLSPSYIIFIGYMVCHLP
jgi:hypothetical protein